VSEYVLFVPQAHQVLERGAPMSRPRPFGGLDGNVRWVRMRVFPALDSNVVVYRLAGVAEDITRKKELEDQLHMLATTDSLTVS